MEVILLQDIKKLGRNGSIIDVASGFVRNYLVPNKLALVANKKNKEIFQKQETLIKEITNTKRKTSLSVLKKITKSLIVIVSSASEDGRLYGSINKKEIAKSLEKFKVNIPINNIFVYNKIKYLGIYKILITFYDNLEITMHIAITRNKSESEKNFIYLSKQNLK
jgi:large subunit ribosomal protein L9